MSSACAQERMSYSGRSGQEPRLLPAVDEVMSAKIAALAFWQRAQPAKTTLFAGGWRSDVRQNRRRRFWPMNKGR
jgi:hypothetical protein